MARLDELVAKIPKSTTAERVIIAILVIPLATIWIPLVLFLFLRDFAQDVKTFTDEDYKSLGMTRGLLFLVTASGIGIILYYTQWRPRLVAIHEARAQSIHGSWPPPRPTA